MLVFKQLFTFLKVCCSIRLNWPIFFTADQNQYEQQLFNLLCEMRKAFDVVDDDDDADGEADVDVPFDERLRRRRIEARGQSFHQPNVDWSSFSTYVDNRRVETTSTDSPMLVRNVDDDEEEI
jgi:hypothetical protein